ncbi:MAG: hypothetical protein ACLFWD_12365 [Anaerolineales bacterium]
MNNGRNKSAMFSLHYYRLKEGVSRQSLAAAFAQAKEEGLFELPGLQEAYLLWGRKGREADQPAALWVYESYGAWEALWGPPEDPIGQDEYPSRWVRWERELLEPLLVGDPDKVPLTSFVVMDAMTHTGGT